MTTWQQVPAEADIVGVVDDDFSISIAETTAAYLVSGATLTAEVYARSDLATVLVTMTAAVTGNGTATVSLTDAQMTTLGAGTYLWRLQSLIGSTDRTVLTGTFKVKAKAYG